VLLACLAGSAPATSWCADEDDPLLTRYPESRLTSRKVDDFASYLLITGQDAKATAFVTEALEGKLTRLVYENPADRSTLEIYRNYRQALESAGADILYFDFDKSDIRPESAPTLEAIAQLLKGEPELEIFVVGHTDSSGALDHNHATLGGARSLRRVRLDGEARHRGDAARRAWRRTARPGRAEHDRSGARAEPPRRARGAMTPHPPMALI
jgi:hypothetical protein